MIKSMTGFGSLQIETDHYIALVEVKSLNSKYLDTIIRLPKFYSDKELDVRAMAADILQRGKIIISLNFEIKGNKLSIPKYNKKLFKAYYDALKELGESVDAPETDYFGIAIQQPDVTSSSDDYEINDQYWKELKDIILKGLQECDLFRINEGNSLEPKIKQSVQVIDQQRGRIKDLDFMRIEKIRARIKQALKNVMGDDKFDQNRFEQELIYFIEKLDITEEHDRLESHLAYFIEVLDSERSNGKKLGFITQEIGREINTMGSKANNAEIQKIVVAMKDELEKIKEQVLNVL